MPYVYGLTCGELATYLNGERLLAGGSRCELIVVPMQGWKRSMTFPRPASSGSHLSPSTAGHLTILLCGHRHPRGTRCDLEGVGYTLPFQVFAAEWIDPGAMAGKMNALRLPE